MNSDFKTRQLQVFHSTYNTFYFMSKRFDLCKITILHSCLSHSALQLQENTLPQQINYHMNFDNLAFMLQTMKLEKNMQHSQNIDAERNKMNITQAPQDVVCSPVPVHVLGEQM